MIPLINSGILPLSKTGAGGGGKFTAFNLTGLKAYYNFEQTTGDLLNQAANVGSTDSNSVNLSNTGVTQIATGLIKNGYDYDVDDDVSEDSGASANWQFGYGLDDKFTIILWYAQNVAIMDTRATLIDNTNSLAGRGFTIAVRDGNNLRIVRFGHHNGTNFELFDTTAGTFPSDTNFHMIMVRVDYDNLTLDISVDNGTVQSFTLIYNGSDGDSQVAMAFGALGRTPPVEEILGKTDEWSFFSRLLTAAEVTGLYNGGAGKVLSGNFS